MHRLRILTLTLLVAGTTMVATSQPAEAAEMIIQDTGKHSRNMQLDFTGTAWFFGNTTWFGGAAWFGIPVVEDGFIPPWNDSFYVEFGTFANYFFFNNLGLADYSYFALVPSGGVRWNFHLTPDWTVFATGKIGVRLPIAGSSLAETRFVGLGSIGAYWHMSEAMYIRLETGNYGVLQAGVSIQL